VIGWFLLCARRSLLFSFPLATEKEEGNNYRSQYPLSEKNLLLRGSILRASEWSAITFRPLVLNALRAICLVVYTGKETKLSLNSKTPPSKLSVVDSVVNRTLIIAISAMMIVCVISAVARLALLSDYRISLNAEQYYLGD
jgi:magnesium-transporting ATPase (P-type)